LSSTNSGLSSTKSLGKAALFRRATQNMTKNNMKQR
jgi:hypothetical protein